MSRLFRNRSELNPTFEERVDEPGPSHPDVARGGASRSVVWSTGTALSGLKIDDYTGPLPCPTARRGNFKYLAHTVEEEMEFDFARFRMTQHKLGLVGATAHLVKGALGIGLLSSHVAFKQGGLLTGFVATFIICLYVTYGLYILVECAHICCRRTRVATMSFSDIGETAVFNFPKKRFAQYSKAVRYWIDVTIMVHLFGTCASYQCIISRTVKQLVEGTQFSVQEPIYPGYPHLRIYILVFFIPIALLSVIHHLKWLVPFTIIGDLIVVLTFLLTIYYGLQHGANVDRVKILCTPYEFVFYAYLISFSMTCNGVMLPIVNHMEDPSQYKIVIVLGMSIATISVYAIGFFGYVAYMDDSRLPITVNFPADRPAAIVKILIIVMFVITHSLNFTVPFQLLYVYISPHIHKHKHHWETFFRGLFASMIGILVIICPTVYQIMIVVGPCCVSFMAFIWPFFFYILLHYHRPGYNLHYWKFWENFLLMCFGIFLFLCGLVFSMHAAYNVFLQTREWERQYTQNQFRALFAFNEFFEVTNFNNKNFNNSSRY